MKTDRKIVIVGGHEQACMVLDYLIENGCDVVLCVARQDDRGENGIFPSLLARSRMHDIPTLQPKKLNAPRVISAVHQLNPDIVLSLQNNMIFGKEWLDLLDEKLGIVNVHYAPLPKYAGYWPEMWAIWNNEKEFAVSMHYVEKGLDTGPLVGQVFFGMDPLETRKSLYEKSSIHCFSMLKKMLPEILDKRVAAGKQLDSERSYFPKSLPNDGYLDLSWDAETKSRFIRAISFPGFPGPKIRIGNQVHTLLAEDIPFFIPVRRTS